MVFRQSSGVHDRSGTNEGRVSRLVFVFHRPQHRIQEPQRLEQTDVDPNRLALSRWNLEELHFRDRRPLERFGALRVGYFETRFRLQRGPTHKSSVHLPTSSA